jgi:hypothetical protein
MSKQKLKKVIKTKKQKSKKALAKKMSVQEAKEYVNRHLISPDSSDVIESQMAEDVNKTLRSKNKTPNVSTDSPSGKYVLMQNLENHLLLSTSCDEGYRPAVIKFIEDLIQEYDCKTSSEKALAQLVALAHYRVLRCSRSLNGIMTIGYCSDLGNNYLNQCSKELDRANRCYLVALQTLKQIKQPPMNVNVKANTAFLAQNQQINTDQVQPNKPDDEIIEQQ